MVKSKHKFEKDCLSFTIIFPIFLSIDVFISEIDISVELKNEQ